MIENLLIIVMILCNVLILVNWDKLVAFGRNLSTYAKEKSTMPPKSTPKEDKELKKALVNYGKMCDKFQVDSAIANTKIDEYRKMGTEKALSQAEILDAKVKSSYDVLCDHRQAIKDTYGYDPGDVDGHKVIM